MSGGGGCDNCGSTTENESLCLCDGCEQESQLANDAAKAAAHAAGYAEAVGDVVAWLETRADEQAKYGPTSPRSLFAGLLYSITQDIRNTAHVGAAKKGAE